jgi:hypothetical protein
MQNLRLCGITRHRQSYRDRPTAAFRHILGRAAENSEQPTGCGRIPTKDKLPWALCDPARPLTCAPLDNNIVERSLKRAVLPRKNALCYRTLNGAQVGDLFMSLIHTCQLCGVSSFDYLVELRRHARELTSHPRAVDAVELSRDPGAKCVSPRFGRVMMNPTWPERIVCGRAGVID